jgi:hypothetical protein
MNGKELEASLFQIDYYTGIYLQRMRKTTEIIIQDVFCFGKHLTSVPPEDSLEAFALHTPRNRFFEVSIMFHVYYSIYQHLFKVAHARKLCT